MCQKKQACAPRDAPYLARLQQVDYTPIFILGDHRSGTTLLYQLLAATAAFNYLSFYHVVRYDELLHNHLHSCEAAARTAVQQQIARNGLRDRIFDRIQVTADLPEEYGYLLKRRPPFWYLPRLTAHTRGNLDEACRKVQAISAPDKPLLLKNPWDFPNFMTLKRAYPTAKFVFIHRHPLPVHNSKLKAMRSALQRKNPYTALLARGYNELFRQPVQLRLARRLFFSRFSIKLLLAYAARATRYFLRHVSALPPRDFISVRYEDLCAYPQQIVAQILAFLGQRARQVVNYADVIRPRPLRLLPEVAAERQRIRRWLRPYLTYNGYGPLAYGVR